MAHILWSSILLHAQSPTERNRRKVNEIVVTI